MSELFAAEIAEELSQGDVFSHSWDDDRTSPTGSVIVLSEGCEIDKSPTVLVAGLVAVTDTETGLMANIRGGRVWRALALEELMPSVWVDYRDIRQVETELLKERIDRRLRSMSELGRRYLCGRMFSFLIHQLPPPSRYFRDENGLVWDVWAVTPKNLAQVEGEVRTKAPDQVRSGWLVFASSQGKRRHYGIPAGWTYMSEEELVRTLKRAGGATPHPVCVLAEDKARA